MREISTPPYTVGEEGWDDGGDGAYHETWLPIEDAQGNEVVRVGQQRWLYQMCFGFKGTDDERAQLAKAICDFMNMESQVAALRAALAPLAKMDAPVGQGHAFDAWPDDRVVFDIGSDRKVTAGDLRRARKAVSP